MPSRMKRKGNPRALLVEIQISAATVESSMEFPQTIKNEIAFWPSNSTYEYLANETKN